MSLLMDALRKAEEEKRRAARDKEAGASEAAALPPDQLASTYPPETRTAETGSTTGEHETEHLSLESMPGEAVASSGDTTDPGSRSAAFGETTQMRLTEAQRNVFDALGVPRKGETMHGVEGVPYDQESTVPSKRMLKKSLEEYFEPSRSMERPRVAAPEQGRGEHPAGLEPGQVTAQTVFSAKRRAGSSTMLNLIAALLLLGAAGLGAVGAYHWYTHSRVASVIPSPTVAQGVEQVESPPLDVPPLQPAAVELPAVATAEPPVTPAPEVTIADTVPAPLEPASGTGSPSTETQPPEAVPPPAPPAPLAPTVEVPAVPLEPPPAQVAAAAPAALPPEEPIFAPATPEPAVAALAPSALDATVMPGEIRIARAPRAQAVVPGQLQEAYQAYQRGDYNRAETLYRSVLTRNPQSRNALLGVAALAWRRGDRAAAAGIYDKLLRWDPQDIAAGSALLALRRSPNAVADESTLKLMLAREPESPQLRFSLGNVYARQSRWAEAQQAYFDALTRDKSNPDYAYNLAVSLDQLGHVGAALDYYRKAVQFSAQRAPRFAAQEANSRIQALASANGSP